MKNTSLLPTLFALFFTTLISCEDNDPPTVCDTANGEWTYVDNESAYLSFDNGEAVTGERLPDGIRVQDRYQYGCQCDTMYMRDVATDFRFWVTFWITSDTTAIINGQYYSHPEFLKRI